VAPYLTFLSAVCALFVGFLQLSGWLLLVLAALAVYGARHYHPENFPSLYSYMHTYVVFLLVLAGVEWIARLASLYMAGHQFMGQVQ